MLEWISERSTLNPMLDCGISLCWNEAYDRYDSSPGLAHHEITTQEQRQNWCPLQHGIIGGLLGSEKTGVGGVRKDIPYVTSEGHCILAPRDLHM